MARTRKPARGDNAADWLAELRPVLELQFPAPPEFDPLQPEGAHVVLGPDGEWEGVYDPAGRETPDALRIDAEMAAHLAMNSPDPTYRRVLAEFEARRLAASEDAGARWVAWVLATLLAADLGAIPPPTGLPHRAGKSLTVTRAERARRRALLGRAWLERDRTHPDESPKARAAALAELGVGGMELKTIEGIAYSPRFRYELELSRFRRDLGRLGG